MLKIQQKRTAKSAPGKKPQLKLMSPKQRIEPKIRPRLGRLASDDRSTFFIDDWGEIF